MTLTLRPYQESAISGIREQFTAGKRRVLLVSPTGSGKTTIFSYVAAGVWRKGKRVCIVAHREFLLSQISGALKAWGVPHGLLVGGSYGLPRQPVVVASVFTLARRMARFPTPDLIVGDEAHHFTPGSTWGKVVDAFPSARVLGVTATPWRLDGRGLGDTFETMVEGPSVAELIADGYLVGTDVYGPAEAPDLTGLRTRGGDYAAAELEAAMDRPTITGSAVDQYLKLCFGMRAIAYTCSIKHATDVAADFTRAGVRAETVHGKMERGEIGAAMARFARGETKVLCSCDLVNEGYDVAGIEVVISLRPTESKSLHIQQLGRGLRPLYADGFDLSTRDGRLEAIACSSKPACIVLDHAGNVKRHGYVDDEQEWTLDAREKRRGDSERVAPVRQCPVCYAMHRPTPVCPKCGHVYIVTGREVEHVDGELVRMVGGEAVGVAEAARKERARRYQILRNIGRKRGIENPSLWAFHIVATELATRLRRERGEVSGTSNGLTEDELTRLWHELGAGGAEESAA